MSPWCTATLGVAQASLGNEWLLSLHCTPWLVATMVTVPILVKPQNPDDPGPELPLELLRLDPAGLHGIATHAEGKRAELLAGYGDPARDAFGKSDNTSVAGRLILMQVYGLCADVCRTTAEAKLRTAHTGHPWAIRVDTAPAWLADGTALLLSALMRRDTLLDGRGKLYPHENRDVAAKEWIQTGQTNGRACFGGGALPALSGCLFGNCPVPTCRTLTIRRISQHGPPGSELYCRTLWAVLIPKNTGETAFAVPPQQRNRPDTAEDHEPCSGLKSGCVTTCTPLEPEDPPTWYGDKADLWIRSANPEGSGEPIWALVVDDGRGRPAWQTNPRSTPLQPVEVLRYTRIKCKGLKAGTRCYTRTHCATSHRTKEIQPSRHRGLALLRRCNKRKRLERQPRTPPCTLR